MIPWKMPVLKGRVMLSAEHGPISPYSVKR